MKIIQHDPQESLYKLCCQIATAHYKLKEEFSNWSEDDFRMSVYSRCANIVESVLFSMIFKKEQLIDKDWYARIPYIKTPTEAQIHGIIGVFDSHLRVLLVTGYFASLETFFRILIKQIFPQYSGNKIHKILEKILDYFDLKDYEHKFNLYRFIRNSLHNNGIVTDPHAYPILYNGLWYNTEKGKPIQVNWLMLCQLTAELDQCLNKIIHSEKVSSLDVIKDPSFSTG